MAWASQIAASPHSFIPIARLHESAMSTILSIGPWSSKLPSAASKKRNFDLLTHKNNKTVKLSLLGYNIAFILRKWCTTIPRFGILLAIAVDFDVRPNPKGDISDSIILTSLLANIFTEMAAVTNEIPATAANAA